MPQQQGPPLRRLLALSVAGSRQRAQILVVAFDLAVLGQGRSRYRRTINCMAKLGAL